MPPSAWVIAPPSPQPPMVNMIPRPPGSQFMPLGAPQLFVPLLMCQPGMPMVPPPPMPKECCLHLHWRKPLFLKNQSRKGKSLMRNLTGQVLEITVESLSETIGSLKEKISREIQLPANKQKLSEKQHVLYDTGLGQKAIINTEVAVNKVGIIKTPNQTIQCKDGFN
ncbi:hypothetical protein RND71_029701 [Anisodus tanguticus]|uniref:Ubiquitin-like domain-containing protein n=1 Tax=Anisodus tanguticus TaxID=243964 RepID=A0AAE1RG00_9SOLA|nr:hypothetical protein RND71_029701 [Anisodus tanguticus]